MPGTQRKFVSFIENLSLNRHHLGCPTKAPILNDIDGATGFARPVFVLQLCVAKSSESDGFQENDDKSSVSVSTGRNYLVIQRSKSTTSPFSEVGKPTSAALECRLKIVSGSFVMFLDKIWTRRPALECINGSSFVKMANVELGKWKRSGNPHFPAAFSLG